MPDNSQSVIRFGVFDADLHTLELRKHGVRLRLPAQSFQELQEALWPSDTFVDFDHSVNAAVNRLREALGDSASDPCMIETLPRRGYRFIGEVMPLAPGPPAATARACRAATCGVEFGATTAASLQFRHRQSWRRQLRRRSSDHLVGSEVFLLTRRQREALA
jgi:hypothetical protein